MKAISIEAVVKCNKLKQHLSRRSVNFPFDVVSVIPRVQSDSVIPLFFNYLKLSEYKRKFAENAF